jgi:hypothetical protein
MRVTFIALFTLTVVVCAQVPLGVERTTDLGHGFRRAIIAERNLSGGFESVGHFEYLFYRRQKLARLDGCLVSPSGEAVLYQEASSGNIFVFRRRDGVTTQLTKKFPGLANRFVWHESEGFVEAFVVPSSTSTKPGEWIKLPITPKA